MIKNEILKKNIHKQGIKTLSSVQKESIPVFQKGHNLLVLAETGSGKTASFLWPMLEKLPKLALIIAPTRELTHQIKEVGEAFSEGMDVSFHIMHGQQNAAEQVNNYQNASSKSKFIIATPGRLLDLLLQNKLSMDRCEFLILDEVDELLDRGFLDEITKIIHYLPKTIQSAAYSATVTDTVRNSLQNLFPEIVTVNLLKDKRDDQRFIVDNVVCDNKEEWLSRFILEHVYDSFLVFVSSREKAHRLNRQLEKRKIQTAALHGNMSQRQRNKSVQAFIDYQVQVLVATDLASRGLDLPEVDYVVNVDLPGQFEQYEHRVGRTGRFDKQGHVLNLYKEKEREHLSYLLREFDKNA